MARPVSDKPSVVNVRTIAQQVGCAPSTVSRVLSGNYGNVRISKKLRDKILAICKQLGYEPNIHASRMFGKRTGVIALATPPQNGESDLHDENLSYFIDTVYETLAAADYRLLLLMLNERFYERQEHLSLMRRKEVDGLIVWGAVEPVAWLDDLFKNGLPFVLGTNRVGSYPCVCSDDMEGMALLVAHCRAKGARQFAYVGGGTTGDCAVRRRQGFIQAMTRKDYRIIPTDFSMESGQRAVPALLHRLPDAIICANDRLAAGVILGLTQAGIGVPDRVLVTGADNTETASLMRPSLTTYDQASATCGRRCAEMLLAHILQGQPLTSELHHPTIHLRQSA